MTRVGRLIRNLLERLAGKYYEGPAPPRRLYEEVRVFRAMYPLASPDEWQAFALRLAQGAYQDGFIRGREWEERAWEGPEVDPEDLLEATNDDWSLAGSTPQLDAMILHGQDPEDPLFGASPVQREEIYRQLGVHNGTFRVVQLNEEGDGD